MSVACAYAASERDCEKEKERERECGGGIAKEHVPFINAAKRVCHADR